MNILLHVTYYKTHEKVAGKLPIFLSFGVSILFLINFLVSVDLAQGHGIDLE